MGITHIVRVINPSKACIIQLLSLIIIGLIKGILSLIKNRYYWGIKKESLKRSKEALYEMGIGRKEENPIPPLNVRREPGGTEITFCQA